MRRDPVRAGIPCPDFLLHWNVLIDNYKEKYYN